MSQRSPDGSGAMFDRIAARYDLLNRILSLGLDKAWRARLVRELGLCADDRVLDVATGTGDVALAVVRRGLGASVVGVDPSLRMLEEGQRKVAALGWSRRIVLVGGDAGRLPFPDRSFDAVTMAFGIRNVPDRSRALAEMRRVLVPGGSLGILELCEPQAGLVGWFARLHVRAVVPRLGALFSSGHEYRYLRESIARFPPPAEFARAIEAVGFIEVRARPLAFGACVHFSARTPEVAP